MEENEKDGYVDNTTENSLFDGGILLHIVIFVIIISSILIFIGICGNRHPDDLIKDIDKNYNEKAEDVQKVMPAHEITKEQEKLLTPFKKYAFKYTYTLNVKGNLDSINFKMQIPQDEQDQQYITGLKMTPAPTRVYRSGINNIAEFTFKDVQPGNIVISTEGIANVRTYDLYTAKILNRNNSKEKNLKRYTQPEAMIESDDEYINNVAKKIAGNTQEEIVKNTFNYVQDHLVYKQTKYNASAKETMKTQIGKCTEFSLLLTALLRARDIPARIVSGNIARSIDQKHTWVEVYFDKYGWVMFDPTSEVGMVNYYVNGKLVRKEKQARNDKSNMQYIASSRNNFSVWYIDYTMSDNPNGTISVAEEIQITKVKE